MSPDQIVIAIAAAYQAYQALRSLGIVQIMDDESLSPEKKAEYLKRIIAAQESVPEWK